MNTPSLKPVKDLFQELVDRRLWPAALILVAAIVAVPVLLGSSSSGSTPSGAAGAAAPVALAAKAKDPAVTDTSVVAVTASGRGLRAGKADNPFVQRGPQAKKTTTASAPGPSLASSASTTSSTSSSSSSGSSSSGGSSSGGSSTPTFGPTARTKGSTPKAPSYQTASIRLRFGRVEADRKLRDLPRLSALPSADNPVLISLGVAKGTHTAVFLVSSDAHAEGDGHCKPSPASCQTVWIKQGQTEFFDVTSATGTTVQYQLDLVAVKYSRTRSKAKAAGSFLKTTKPTAALGASTTAKKLAATGAGDAATTHLPLITDLEWSGKLGRVLGVRAPKKADGDHGTPGHPVVVPAGALDEISLPSAP